MQLNWRVISQRTVSTTTCRAVQRGKGNVQAMIAGFIQSWTATEWEVLNLPSAAEVVVAERLDRTKAGDKAVDLPCTGVFVMENGKIKVWRDYFDFTTSVKAMACWAGARHPAAVLNPARIGNTSRVLGS